MVFFIGQPVVKHGSIDLKSFIAIVDSIKKYFKKNEIDFKYFAHRTEETCLLPKEWNIQILDMPLELHIMKQENVPSNIVTFHSSAIVNLKILFGDMISAQAIKLPFPLINTRDKVLLENLYKYFNNELYDIIELVEFDHFKNTQME